MLIKDFDRRYATITQAATVVAIVSVATAGLQRGGTTQYREFSNRKPRELKGNKDPIIDLRWIYHIEGCFYMCSCHEDWKVKFVLNLLC